MAFPARVFRILIASPADVAEERDIAVRIIQEWNDLNSAERELVLLPVRWETHSAPEYGRRPQEVINRQVVDQCDFLVGIFTEPDLITLDLMMPGLTGFELCKLLHDEPKFANTPIVIVSAKDDPESMEQAKQAGAIDYLTKPFGLDEFLKKIKPFVSI